jgi:hypothetical protein
MSLGLPSPPTSASPSTMADAGFSSTGIDFHQFLTIRQ